jgi:NaMN:DMB phosphoribosyltransferase
VLLVEAELESFLIFGIEGQEIGIFAGAAVQDATAIVDGGVENGAVHAAIFGLNVDNHAIYGYVGVVTEQHSLILDV